MSWLRIDDGFTSNAKIAQLNDRDFRVWFRLLCHCARSKDPSVDTAAMNEVAGLTKAAVSRFAELGLLDEIGTGAEVHDWSAYQPRDQTNAERQERWRARKTITPGVTDAVTPPVTGTAIQTVTEALPRARAHARSRPVPSEEEKTDSASSGIEEVYDHWRQARSKSRANYDRLSDGRRAKLKARLREFSVDDLKRAIDGVANDPWADRALHDDLTIVFRSRESVERFLEFADNPPSRNGLKAALPPLERAKAWVETVGWRYPDTDLLEELGRFGLEGDEKRHLAEVAYAIQEREGVPA